YFDTTKPDGVRIAVLDSGVRETHVLFNNPSHLGVLRDCHNGRGSQCEERTFPFLYDSSDHCNHGTPTIGIIAGNSQLGQESRGVTANIVDSFKITPILGCNPQTDAIIRGFG